MPHSQEESSRLVKYNPARFHPSTEACGLAQDKDRAVHWLHPERLAL